MFFSLYKRGFGGGHVPESRWQTMGNHCLFSGQDSAEGANRFPKESLKLCLVVGFFLFFFVRKQNQKSSRLDIHFDLYFFQNLH